MARVIRLIHSQETEGSLLISDIEAGLPNTGFGTLRKQPGVYLPHYHIFFGDDGLVEEDRSKPGFVDLVVTDAVKLSLEAGDLSVFSEMGVLETVELPAGALKAPRIEEAVRAGDTLTVTGRNFESVEPDETYVLIEGKRFEIEEGGDGEEVKVDLEGVESQSEVEVVVVANRKKSNAVLMQGGTPDPEPDAGGNEDGGGEGEGEGEGDDPVSGGD